MSKPQKKSDQKKSSEIGFSFDKMIPVKYQTLFFLSLIFILIVIFFSPVVFGGKATASGDFLQGKSLREYATKERDGLSLWNPHIFCGMPAVVTALSPRWFDLTSAIYSILSLAFYSITSDYSITYLLSFIILGFSAYFLMRELGQSRGISFLTAAAVTFSTGISVLFFIGHITKLKSLALFPFILLMLFRFQKEIKLIDVLLFVVGIHLLALGAHVQIVFYFLLTILIYFIYYFTRSFITKDQLLQKQLVKTLFVSAAACIVALMMSFDTYSQLYEYKPYSTRGTKSITELDNPAAQSQTNSYEYNTSWSFSPGELLTFIVPSYYGFGKSTYKGPLSQNRDVEVNTYFGQMPFVDAAMYMGVVVFALAIFSMIVRRKEPLVQFLSVVVIFFILISFGKNFPLVFDLMYYHFPFFDNFRVPSMILHVVQILIPVLAGLGVMELIKLRENKNPSVKKGLKYTALVFSGLFVISFLFSSGVSSWFTERINEYASSLGNTQQAQMFNALQKYMSDMFVGDLQIALALLAITFCIGYAFITLKVNKEILVLTLSLLIIFDLFRISNRGAVYEDLDYINELFKEPDYISVIKQQNEKEPYRIINLKQDGSLGSISQNSNFNVYFLQEDFYGYSAAKPRSYQDFMDVVGPTNYTLWKMLGVKYLVTSRPFPFEYFTTIYTSPDSTTFVHRNDSSLSRIYFVDRVDKMTSKELMNLIKANEINPKEVAFVEDADLKTDKPGNEAYSKIIEYKDEYVSAEVNATGNNFLFYGTTFMPGWKAYINGNETKVYKTNHGFQGILVPPGKHKVEFIYKPAGFLLGKYTSLILNIFLLGGIIVLIFVKKQKQ
ncbi:MAG: YfhO family protein [Bacteroidota bacterium]